MIMRKRLTSGFYRCVVDKHNDRSPLASLLLIPFSNPIVLLASDWNKM